MAKDRIFEITDLVRETGFAIHQYLGWGHLEKVYERSLASRLQKLGLDVEVQLPIQIRDEDGTELGDYFADLLVENLLILELKAVRTIAPEHTAQLFGYLRGSRIEHGALLNFGAPKFYIRKFILSDSKAGT